jgi:AhpD family alkylhydroperoxidase
MKQRIDWKAVAPEGFAAQRGLETYARRAGLDSTLLELVKTRTSQINGCAYCLDMHTKDARANGETEQRLYALAAWHEAPFYSDRERAALMDQAVTRIGENGPRTVYAEARHLAKNRRPDTAIVAIKLEPARGRVCLRQHLYPGAVPRPQPQAGRDDTARLRPSLRRAREAGACGVEATRCLLGSSNRSAASAAWWHSSLLCSVR